ncbi:Uma2 family endonuclease [Streptomyces sp. JJ66]|uniref:Uma2 family endonuclease n=1 Tax=Streptomyces sp. JJ66 TaxID=2803843 RepID=UPI001C58ACAA|nr:Uma2 family endonuclease [Streptomyces sp. JJ66]MBW1602831.1 Uma2 family endonuclease [Streptomyces sp. JJ66]
MTATLPEAEVAKTLREVAHELPVPDQYRVEIIEGAIVMSPTPSGMHGRMLWRLAEMLLEKLPEGYEIENNLGVDKAPDSDDYCVPDLFVAPRHVLETWETEVPPMEVIFVAEVVSRSSQAHDRVSKRKVYAEAGIPLYLLIDPLEARLALFYQPVRGAYRGEHTVPWGDKIQLPEPLPALVDSSRFPSLEGRPRP